jgi:hypothetical protein
MIALSTLLVVGSAGLVAVGALLPGLFSLAVIGLALFTGSAMLGMAGRHPRRRRSHR